MGNQRKPAYRRVRKYFKTTRQYRRERVRRKLVLMLYENEHLTLNQIAERLKVSERTVKRDLAKIRPYYFRRIRHCLNALQEENERQLDAKFAKMGLHEQLNLLKSQCKQLERMKNGMPRQNRHHHLQFVIDADVLVNGHPQMKIIPDKPETKFAMPLTVTVFYSKDNNMVEIGEITLSLSG